MADNNQGTWLGSMFQGMTGMFTAFGQYMRGEAGASDALARASANTFNAQRIREATGQAIESTERGRRAFIGGQQVARAKSGVAAGGSGELAISEADRAFAMDVQALKNRAALEAIELQSETEFAKIEAKASSRAGRLGAFGTLLQAGGDIANAFDLKNGLKVGE